MERLTRTEENSLVLRCQSGDKEAGEILVAQYERFAWKHGRKAAPHRSFIDDFVQLARMHFWDSVLRFDTQNGARLITWASKRVGLLLLKDRIAYMGILKQSPLSYYEDGPQPRAMSLDMPHVLRNGTKIPSDELLEIADDGPSRIDDADDWQAVLETIGLQNPRTREIMRSRLAGKTLQQIGEQYGINREAVRQVERRVLGAIRAKLTGLPESA